MSYIAKDLLLNCLEDLAHENLIGNDNNTFISLPEAQDRIEELSTEDVVEVKHGKWMLMGTEMFMDESYSSKFCCSLCSREVGVCHEHDSDKHKYVKAMYPYCHCGAKMDLED